MNICKGIPGSQAHRTTDELVAELCDACSDKLVSTQSWSSQLDTAKTVAQSEGGKKSKGNANFIRFAGSRDFESEDKKKRKQPWGMERE